MPGTTPTRPPTRAPATRDQVDAYRYGLRRMEAALVRGDPVPLHEQLRSQRRAAFAGVLLGLLALGGVAVHALVVPRPDWTRQVLVVGDRSGAVYAVAHGPDRLVPVANPAAGRLVLAALGDPGGPTAVPVVVADDDLTGAPRTATAAVPGAVGVRPDAPGPDARWSICDRVDPAGRGRLVGTTVVAGSDPAPAPAQAGVLLTVAGGASYAVIDGRRHRVELTDRALLAVLGLDPAAARPAAPGLVSAIPEGPPLLTPVIPAGRAPAGVPGRVGDVVTATPIGGAPRFYAVLPGGLQDVPPLAARVLSAAAGRDPVEVGPATVAAAPAVRVLDVADWPVPPATWADPATAPVLCWNWTPEATTVSTGPALPVPAGATSIDLAQADGAGQRLDTVVLGGGAGGPVTATAPGQPAGAGTTWLVSATGVAYGIPDAASAAALGVTAAQPAPEAALRLLPTGPALDLAAARVVADVATG